MLNMDMKKIILDNVIKAVNNTKSITWNDSINKNVNVERPENDNFGDYSTNVALIISKVFGGRPIDIAKDISLELNSYDISFEYESLTYPVFENIEAVSPGFINFKLSEVYLKYLLSGIFNQKERYGSSNEGGNKNIIIEYSAPNPNKPLHIGHARNNFLGSSLAEIYSFSGYRVIKMNYLNDWGTHICKAMLMYKKYGNNGGPDKKPDHYVGEFYVRYEKEAENNTDLDKELGEIFQKLENDDGETIKLWKKIVQWAYEGWEQTYKEENVDFDVWMRQSDYRKSGKEVVDLAVEKGIAERDETGAVIARLEKYNLPDKVILRRDGTSVYATQDIQLAIDSYDKYIFDRRIYVVDNRQSDYFKQLFKIIELLGYRWFDKLYHLAYGVVTLPEGSMSSRKGLLASADEIFQNIKEAEKEEIYRGLERMLDKSEVVEKISLAAFRYGLLKVDPKQDVVFSIDQITKFEGNTGPYLLYTYARIMSVLEKAGFTQEICDYQRLNTLKDISISAKSILRTLNVFPEIVNISCKRNSPHFVANYLNDLAQKFNAFYGEERILDIKDETAGYFKLCLSKAVSIVLKIGLSLLKINVVEKM